jgi:chemotaxis protein MotB
MKGIQSNILRTVRTAALFGVCGLALGGCVSQQKYDDLARERKALVDKKQSLEQSVAENQNRLASTSAELATMRAKAAENEALLVEQQSRLALANEQLESIKARAAEQEAMFSKLNQELSSEVENQTLTIRQMKNGISVDLPEEILFRSGSATLRKSGREVLAKISEQLKDANYQIVVSGFTDNKPILGKLARRFSSNWDLAAARATNVVHLLQENNVPATKLVAASYGENNAVANNDTEDGRKQNRRIEIHLRPVVQE